MTKAVELSWHPSNTISILSDSGKTQSQNKPEETVSRAPRSVPSL